MEIVAFTKAYNMDVRVHQRSNVPYFVQAGNDGVGIAHIAYDQVITSPSPINKHILIALNRLGNIIRPFEA